MTGLAQLLADCNAHGVRLLPAGDGGLTIDAPQGALTPELIGRLKAHKAELLAILLPEADATGQAGQAAGERADDCTPEALGLDGCPADSIDADELDPCPKCGTLELWQSLAGDWRCLLCDPPTAALRLLELAERIRQRKNRTACTRQKG